MRVNQQFSAGSRFIIFGSVASEVHFTDFVPRKTVDVGTRVVTHVVRADHNVADVAQQLAAGASGDFGKKFCFWDRR